MFKQQLKIDWQLFLPTLIIITLGLTALSSISFTIFSTQLIFFIIGLIVFYLFSNFNYQSHQQLIGVYILVCLFLLLLPFIFGAVTRGSIRWIQLGSLTLQPSEIIKPFIVLIFAAFISQKDSSHQLAQLFKYFLVFIIPALLIFKQPDLGSTLVVASIWLGILFASDLSLLLPISLVSITALLSPIIFKFLKPYQKIRISSFLHPFNDPKGSGYHLIQSIIAIGSGGFFGKGLGSGTQSQLQFLPEHHTDFIFASLAEELGFGASLILLLTYFYLLNHLLDLAKSAPDQFSRLIIIGVFSMIFFQAAVNIGMNLGIMPITGITLPLVSAGGSSLLATLISLGVVHNISVHSIHQKGLEIS